MPAEKPFEALLSHSWPPAAWLDVRVLLAVSGGADSMAMLRAMHALASQQSGTGQLMVAHLNHCLRDDASDDDARFVAQACEQLGLACEIVRTDVAHSASVAGDGIEAAARDARYRFLQDTAERLGARYVATAHTADDQAETVLHRIVRGTGIAGLAGIPRTRALGTAVTVIRPLLDVQRADVESYLTSIDQAWREDASNRDERFTRNRIRHDLLPLIREQHNQNVSDALRRLAVQAGEAQAIIEPLVFQLAERTVELSGDRVWFDTPTLAEQPRFLVRELLKAVWRRQQWPEQAMGFVDWERLATFIIEDVDGGRLTLPGYVTAARRDDRVVLSRDA